MKTAGTAFLLVIILVLLGGLGGLSANAGDQLPSCDVTLPNGKTPPSERPSDGYYGDGVMYTTLWPDGIVRFEQGGPGEINPDGSLGMKWGWWRYALGVLQIEGHRLDAPAPPLVASIPDGYGGVFQATGLIFSTEGCWEVTAHVGDTSFVTLVVRTP